MVYTTVISTPAALTPSTHSVRGWVNPISVQDTLGKKAKGKVRPITGHESPKLGALSLTSELHGVGG
jgi:hypothetical protein